MLLILLQNKILNSKSWRLTEPLRTFRRYLPGKLRRLNEGAASHSASGPAGPGDRQGSAVIADSDFDAEFYCKAYPDIRGQDPYVHYIRNGKKKERPSLRPWSSRDRWIGKAGSIKRDGLDRQSRSEPIRSADPCPEYS